MMAETQDGHRFGIRDRLVGQDYRMGEEIRAKVLDYLGRQDYLNFKGDTEKAGTFKVDAGNGPQLYKLGISDEVWIAKNYPIRSYADLKGKTLVLKVCQKSAAIIYLKVTAVI
jgi:hypothetical protein